MTSSKYTAVCDLPARHPDEIQGLREHIRQFGVLDLVHLDERGRIIDGLDRMKIADEIGTPYQTKVHTGTEEELRALRRGLNMARRHLTQQQKRDLIEAQLRDTPKWSNRRIAQALGVTHPTVSKVRREMETTGNITTPEATVGLDGKSRPAREPLDLKSMGDEDVQVTEAGPEPAGVAPKPSPASSPAPPADAARRTRLILGACPEGAFDLLMAPSTAGLDLVLADCPYPAIERPYGCYSEAEWLEMMRQTATACWEMLKPTGSMVFILEPNSAKAGRMRTWHLEFALWAAKEFGLVQDAYWLNPCPMPGSRKGLLRSAIKWCVWLGGPKCYRDQDKVLKDRYVPDRKRGDERKAGPSGRSRRMDQMYETAARRGGATPFNVIEVPTSTGSPGSEGHPAVTPLPVADWWCRYLLPPGGVLLDPFVGSGTMLVAGLNNGASEVIGIEKEEQYLDICRKRLGLAEAA